MAPPQSPSLAPDADMDASLSFIELGRRPPVVLLHGLFGSSRNWLSVARALSESHHVFALDLRNHGDSPWDREMDYRLMAEDVRRFIADKIGQPPIVLGHSAGGKTAMTLALEHGEAIEGLIVVDVAPATYDQSHLLYVQAMKDVDLFGVKRRAEVEAQLMDQISDTRDRTFLMQNLVAGDDGLVWRLNLDALAANMTKLVGFPEDLLERQFRGRTLLIEGGQSDYVQGDHYRLFQHLFPRLQMDVIADAGHYVHADSPDAFIERVRAFLSVES